MRVSAEKSRRRAWSSAGSRLAPSFSANATTVLPSGVVSKQDEEIGRLNQRLGVDVSERNEFGRLTAAERDRAGLVEQQRLHVARRFHRLPGHGEHVETHRAVDPGDADGREQRADGRGDEGDQKRDQIGDIDARVQILGHRRHRRHDNDEDQSEDGKQDGECHLVRRLLPLGTFDQMDHAVEEALARIDGDPDEQLVRDDRRAGGDRGEHVGSGLFEHGCRLAGDGGFVDIRDPFGDLAVGRNDLAFRDADQILLAQGRRRDLLRLAGGQEPLGHQLGLGPAQRGSLRLAPSFRQRLRKIREPYRQHQNHGHYAVIGRRGTRWSEQAGSHREKGGYDSAKPDHEHHGVANCTRGSNFITEAASALHSRSAPYGSSSRALLAARRSSARRNFRRSVTSWSCAGEVSS